MCAGKGGHPRAGPGSACPARTGAGNHRRGARRAQTRCHLVLAAEHGRRPRPGFRTQPTRHASGTGRASGARRRANLPASPQSAGMANMPATPASSSCQKAGTDSATCFDLASPIMSAFVRESALPTLARELLDSAWAGTHVRVVSPTPRIAVRGDRDVRCSAIRSGGLNDDAVSSHPLDGKGPPLRRRGRQATGRRDRIAMRRDPAGQPGQLFRWSAGYSCGCGMRCQANGPKVVAVVL
jgi:hypothetical protein